MGGEANVRTLLVVRSCIGHRHSQRHDEVLEAVDVEADDEVPDDVTSASATAAVVVCVVVVTTGRDVAAAAVTAAAVTSSTTSSSEWSAVSWKHILLRGVRGGKREQLKGSGHSYPYFRIRGSQPSRARSHMNLSRTVRVDVTGVRVVGPFLIVSRGRAGDSKGRRT